MLLVFYNQSANKSSSFQFSKRNKAKKVQYSCKKTVLWNVFLDGILSLRMREIEA